MLRFRLFNEMNEWREGRALVTFRMLGQQRDATPRAIHTRICIDSDVPRWMYALALRLLPGDRIAAMNISLPYAGGAFNFFLSSSWFGAWQAGERPDY